MEGHRLAHTRRVEPPPPPSRLSRVRSRDWSCCGGDAGDSVASPQPFCLPLPRVSTACSSAARRPRLHFPPSLHHTHARPPPPDHGSGQWQRRRRGQQPREQQRLSARLLGTGGHGSPRVGPVRRRRRPLAAVAAEAQREHHSAAFSRQLHVSAKPFVPNVHAAEFVPSFLRGPAQPSPVPTTTEPAVAREALRVKGPGRGSSRAGGRSPA